MNVVPWFIFFGCGRSVRNVVPSNEPTTYSLVPDVSTHCCTPSSVIGNRSGHSKSQSAAYRLANVQCRRSGEV